MKFLSLKFFTAALMIVIFAINPVIENYSAVHAADSPSQDPALDELLERFASTKAIGVFTKLSIKGNVTRLYRSISLYHQGERPPHMQELKQRYDLMVQEMVMLVQNKDPELARDFNACRSLLWSYLSDPVKYKTI